MAKQSTWIHGINVVSQIQSTDALEQVNAGKSGVKNSDVMGYNDSAVFPPNLSKLSGKWFQSRGNVSNAFLCAIPTPTTINGNRPFLQDVMVLYSADASVTLDAVDLFDGPNIVAPYDFALTTSRNNNGVGGSQDLVEGMTSFSAEKFISPVVGGPSGANYKFNWGMCVVLTFSFGQDNSRVFFSSAGADFDA